MILEVKKNLLLLFCILVIWACGSKDKSYVRLAGNAQGTTFSVIYEGNVDHPYKSEVDSILKAIDQSMSLWDDKSIINAFNASADSVRVDTLLKEVFLRSKYFYEISEGAFDPTVEPLMEVWGFARKNNLSMPDDARIDSLKRFIGLSRCHLRGDYVVKDIKGIQLDFNAIAQGYTVDVLARFLEQKGVKNYLVEIGGEVLAKGKNESGENWHVGIESPEFNSGDGMNPLQGVISLSDGALATSGNYRKYIIKDKKLFSHTIDPSTGKPVTHSLLSVSVIAPSAMDADAYATMFMVMGEEKALQMAANLGLKIQCISSVEGELSVSHSPGFQELIVVAD